MAAKKPQTKLQTQLDKLQKPLGLRRPLAWLLFLPILLGFLIVPIMASEWATPAKVPSANKAVAQTVKGQIVPSVLNTQGNPHTLLALDKSWNPGPLDAVHQAWQGDCQACHTGNFSRVKDESCESCHQHMGLHVAKADLPKTHFTEGRCASCHHDHKGLNSLAEQNRHFSGSDCAACHSHIKDTAPETKTLPVADFAKEHPAFRLTLATGPDQGDLTRVRMEPGHALGEKTSFKFPHDVHLDPKGVDGPNKKVVMVCSDCHTPADTPTGFLPVTMEKNCQSCHTLNFEPALPDRQVPHGPVQAVLSTVDEFYSYLAVHPEERNRINALRGQLRTRPGEKDPQRSMLQNLSGNPRAQATLATRELFEKTACVVCHTVEKVPGTGNTKTSGAYLPQYKIDPMPVQHSWMPMAKFSHKAHAFDKCESCHAATTSKKASDVLMPDINSCRTCHAGAKAETNKVKSDCGLCHGYHLHKPLETAGITGIQEAETSNK